jgi:hypothetical protein
MALRLLGIDGATKFGWAYGPTDGVPLSGHGVFGEAGNHPEIFAGAMHWVKRFTSEHPVDAVVIEALNAHKMAGMTRKETIYVLAGIVGALQGAFHCCHVFRQATVDCQDIRQFFIGVRNLKTDPAKKAVKDRCIALGYVEPAVKSLDQTDAIAVWAWGANHYDPDNGVRFSPLFQQAA